MSLSYVEELNLKTMPWDTTCTHGLSTNKVGVYNVTVFPTTIGNFYKYLFFIQGLGASFDIDLIKSVSNTTAIEARFFLINYFDLF